MRIRINLSLWRFIPQGGDRSVRYVVALGPDLTGIVTQRNPSYTSVDIIIMTDSCPQSKRLLVIKEEPATHKREISPVNSNC